MRSKTIGILLAAILLASILVAIAPVESSETWLNAELSTNSVNITDEFFIFGTALGVDGVNILIVPPKGGGGDRIDGSGTGIYHRIALTDVDDAFSQKISVGLGIDTGIYLVVVLHPGRDGVYSGFPGGVSVSNFMEELEKHISVKSQAQIIEIIEDAITAPGSDDLMWTGTIAVESEVKQPYGACAYSEECVMSIMRREVECDCTFRWTGYAAASLAGDIDREYWDKTAPGFPDGRCSAGELDTFVYHEIQRPWKDELVNNILIDGTQGKIVGSDSSYTYPGYEAIKEDLSIKCTYWIDFGDLERSDEHVYSRAGLKDGDFVSFTVPMGWIISSAEDLKGSSISTDKRTVNGIATNKVYAIKFSKAAISSPSLTVTPVPSPTPTASPMPTYTPVATIIPTASPTTPTAIPAAEAPEERGFEAIFALAGLLVVAHRILRRG
jgi:hypothetical protein